MCSSHLQRRQMESMQSSTIESLLSCLSKSRLDLRRAMSAQALVLRNETYRETSQGVSLAYAIASSEELLQTSDTAAMMFATALLLNWSVIWASPLGPRLH